MDSNIKILWISDIHIKGEGKTNEEINNEYKIFKKKLGNFFDFFNRGKNAGKEKFSEIDYVVISGDLVNRPKKSNYNYLKIFINDIRIHADNAKILIVPGNHDVNRNFNIDTSRKFIETITKNKGENRKEFFDNPENHKYFNELYTNYKNFSNSFLPDSFIKSKDGTCGYLLDKKNRLLFVLLNSTWFSLGRIFLEQYLTSIKPGNFPDAKEIDQLLNEAGNQMIALDSINKEFATQLIKVIHKYSDYLVITIMHHPPHWLLLEQRWDKDKYPYLHAVLSHTDLLLSGHEHAFTSVDKQLLFKKTYHLQGGCFLCNDNLGWFSFLEVNTIKKNVTQIKFKYKENIWKKENVESVVQLDKKLNVKIDIERLLDVHKILSNNFKKITKEIIGKKIDDKNIILDNSYLLLVKTKNELIFFVKKLDVVKILTWLNELIFERKIIKEKVRFYFFDVFHPQKEIIYSEKFIRDAATKINLLYDSFFDEIRQKFFSPLNETQVAIIKKTRFVSETLPFWHLEKYIF